MLAALPSHLQQQLRAVLQPGLEVLQEVTEELDLRVCELQNLGLALKLHQEVILLHLAGEELHRSYSQSAHIMNIIMMH